MKTEKEIIEYVEAIEETLKLIRALGSTIPALDAYQKALIWVLEVPDTQA